MWYYLIMLLEKIFIKDYTNIGNPKVRKQYGILSGIVGIVLNLIISSLKVVCGALFFSISLLADGLNNLSDAGSSIVSLVGFKIADRPADSEHPFGHARVEYICGMIISFIILFIGLQLVISSVEGIITPAVSEFNNLVLGILIGSILVKIYLVVFNRLLGKKIDSATLKATATDSLCDAVATTAVLAAMLITKYTGVNLDAYMGLLVAVFIFFSGIRMLKETMSPLVGEKPNRELVDHICTKIHAYDNVLGIHDLVVHNYGHARNFASVHVEVDSKRDIMDSHEMVDRIEREFEQEGIHLVIHLDPIVTGDEEAERLKALVVCEVLKIDDRFSIHDFRTVPGKTRTNLIFDLVVPVGIKSTDAELRELVQTAVHAADEKLYTVISVDRNYCME